MNRIAAVSRRTVGVCLVLLTVIPLWRLLSSSSAPVAQQALRLTDSYAILLAQGTAALLVLAAAAAILLSPDTFSRFTNMIGEWISSRRTLPYALFLAAVSCALTLMVSWYVWGTKPALIDALAQFVHARFVAAGLLAGPPGLPYEFWVVSNTFVTENGWVSQYPLGHVVAVAVGFTAGLVWLICPLLMAIAVAFTSLAAERLFEKDRIVARLGALLFATSPFLVCLAAAHMSHVTAAAFVAVAAYFALRARDEEWIWALATGVAVGAAFATRPLSGLVLGSVVTVGVWITGLAARERTWRYLVTRLVAAFIGALPFGLAVAAYNARFFGGPLNFGYTASFGPSHGFGFHTDPLGNQFGPAEGLAFTSSDLTALGYHLLRTPLSAVLVVGVFLVLSRRLTVGTRLVTAWALALIVPLGFYWHHDLMLGPRMISEAAPAWCLLTAASGLGLVRMAPLQGSLLGREFSPRVFVGTVLCGALFLGFSYFAPRDILNYGRVFAEPTSAAKPTSPTLVFVHDSWSDRIVAKLVASRMRGDSVSAALARNSTCRLHEFAEAYFRREMTGTAPVLPTLVFGNRDTDGSQPVTLPNGVVVRARQGEQLTPECQAEAESDRGGTIPLMPLLWQGDLPGVPGYGAMFVRDFGPEANARLVARFPRRSIGVLYRRHEDGLPVLVPYEQGMRALWGEG